MIPQVTSVITNKWQAFKVARNFVSCNLNFVSLHNKDNAIFWNLWSKYFQAFVCIIIKWQVFRQREPSLLFLIIQYVKHKTANPVTRTNFCYLWKVSMSNSRHKTSNSIPSTGKTHIGLYISLGTKRLSQLADLMCFEFKHTNLLHTKSMFACSILILATNYDTVFTIFTHLLQ